jgi:hypothetical protein
MFDTTTKTGKLADALVNQGQVLTAAQAKKSFGIASMSAAVATLRGDGFAIYGNQRKAANGTVVTEYRHGKASRKLIAAGYKALGASAFTKALAVAPAKSTKTAKTAVKAKAAVKAAKVKA